MATKGKSKSKGKTKIKIAPSKVGSFTAWCRRKGWDGVTAECIKAGLAVGGAIGKKANFARNSRRWGN